MYLYLSTAGETTVSELHLALGMRKLTLLGVLRSLESRSLVEATETGYVLRGIRPT